MPKLTDTYIRRLTVKEGKKDIHAFDDECPGFGVRKQASGHITFFVKYTVAGTEQQRKRTLAVWEPGLIAALRNEAKVFIAQPALGKDVIGEANRSRPPKERRWASSSARIWSCARPETNSGNRCDLRASMR